jgi:hypothetical protein
MDPRTQRIRAFNDQLRQNLATGVAVMTPGVAALGEEAAARIGPREHLIARRK